MTVNVSSDTIKKLLEKVKHPSIDDTLLNLGIIKNVEVEGNKVIITLAFPFENILIKELLVNLVKEPLDRLKMDIEIKTTTMDKKELQKFLNLEQKNWTG